MPKQTYPYIPKSTAHMREGEFWEIPLSNGEFACGRVLQFDLSSGKKASRSFLAGLMNWCGDEIPTAEAIAGAKLLEQGDVHIRTIAFNGGSMRGFRSLEEDQIEPMLELSHAPLNDCRLMKGYIPLRLATLDERKTLYTRKGWGLGVIKILAEAYFVRKSPPVKRQPWEELQKLLRHLE